MTFSHHNSPRTCHSSFRLRDTPLEKDVLLSSTGGCSSCWGPRSISQGLRERPAWWLFLFSSSSCPSYTLPRQLSAPSGSTPGAIPLINVGAGPMEAQFERLTFAQMILNDQNHAGEEERARRQNLVDSGTVSALDLAAPNKAIGEFNQATGMMRGQQSQEAIAHLEKAIAVYPKFVSAHNYLGLAYLDFDDTARARVEFETAANLDPKFASSYVNLGRLALSQKDYVAAEGYLAKAVALRPVDPSVLTVLAYAQHGHREYREAIETVNRVHAVEHPGLGNAHYVAAVAAIALNDFALAQSELCCFWRKTRPTRSQLRRARTSTLWLGIRPPSPPVILSRSMQPMPLNLMRTWPTRLNSKRKSPPLETKRPTIAVPSARVAA